MLLINSHSFKYFKLGFVYIILYVYNNIYCIMLRYKHIGANEVHGGISDKRSDLNHIIYLTYFLIDFGVRNYFVYGSLYFVKCKDI